MAPWKRKLWILWAGVLLCSSSYTMCIPFLPLYLYDLGVDQSSVHLWAGVVISSSFLVGAVMGPLWGALADKYGKRKMVIRAGFSLAVIYALYAVVSEPWQLVGIRLLQGFSSGFVPASMAIVASTVPKKELGWSLGIMQSGTMTGGILGPLLGGALATMFGMRLSFIVAACCICLATIAVILLVKEEPAAQTKAEETVRRADAGAQPSRSGWSMLTGAVLFMLAFLFINQFCVNALQPIITLHMAELQGGGKDAAALSSGLVLSLVGIAGIIASPIWGRSQTKLGPRLVLQLCLLTAGCIIAVQYFVHSMALFMTVQFMFGLFMAGIAPTVNTIIMQNTSANSRGRSFGITATANQLGGMLGPLVGGAVGIWLGNEWVFVAVGLLLLLSGICIRLKFPGEAVPLPRARPEQRTVAGTRQG